MHYLKSLLQYGRFKSTLLFSRSILKKQFSTSVINNVEQPVEFMVPTPWGHIAGKEWGPKNGHPVIAVHGWQDSSSTFDTLIPHLKKDLHIYALDLPGHGLSSHIPQGMLYSVMLYATAIHLVVEHLKLEKFFFMGHSLGGQLGYNYSSTYPEKVSHFIAMEGFKPVLRSINQFSPLIRQNLEYFSKPKKENSTPPQYTRDELLDKMCAVLNNSLTRKSAEVLFDRATTKCTDGKYTLNRDPRLRLPIPPAFAQSDHLSLIYGSNMTCHVLVVKAIPGAEWEPALVEKCAVDMLRNSLPSLRYEQLSGSHYFHLNSPEKVAPIINQVLEL